MDPSSSRRFQMPTRMKTRDGHERRVGFEFEYSGVGLERSAEVVAELSGGRVSRNHRFCYRVTDSRFGDFAIESDSSILAKKKWEKYFRLLGLDPSSEPLAETVEEWVERFSEDVIPYEIVTPPLNLSDIEFVERLRERLREEGALGTHARFFSAFGLQFNPEMPDLTVETLLAYQRAFFLLYDRLLATEDVPIARRVLPFIDPFPQEYVALVLDESYRPTLRTFMKDYLEANPTRNRALDWLPLFAYIDRDLTFSYPVEVELVKPRPTLHYRLPSSLIDEPDWNIATEWNKWVEIERLAARPELLRKMSREFEKLHRPLTLLSESRWIKRSGELIDGTLA